MTQVCKICSHAQRINIDKEILQGAVLAQLAKKFGVPYHSLYAHSVTHVSTRLARAMERRELQQGFNLMDDIEVLRKRLEEMFTTAQSKGHTGTSLKITSEQRAFIELLAKISYANIQERIKELEEENTRLRSGEVDPDVANAFQRKLGVFTFPELEMLSRLSNKLVSQDKSNIIIPEKPDEFKHAIPQVEEDKPSALRKTAKDCDIESDDNSLDEYNRRIESEQPGLHGYVNGRIQFNVDDPLDIKTQLRKEHERQAHMDDNEGFRSLQEFKRSLHRSK